MHSNSVGTGTGIRNVQILLYVIHKIAPPNRNCSISQHQESVLSPHDWFGLQTNPLCTSRLALYNNNDEDRTHQNTTKVASVLPIHACTPHLRNVVSSVSNSNCYSIPVAAACMKEMHTTCTKVWYCSCLLAGSWWFKIQPHACVPPTSTLPAHLTRPLRCVDNLIRTSSRTCTVQEQHGKCADCTLTSAQ